MQIDKLKLLESDSLHCWNDWGELTDLNSRPLFTDSKNLLSLLCRVGPFIGPISLCLPDHMFGKVRHVKSKGSAGQGQYHKAISLITLWA